MNREAWSGGLGLGVTRRGVTWRDVTCRGAAWSGGTGLGPAGSGKAWHGLAQQPSRVKKAIAATALCALSLGAFGGVASAVVDPGGGGSHCAYLRYRNPDDGSRLWSRWYHAQGC